MCHVHVSIGAINQRLKKALCIVGEINILKIKYSMIGSVKYMYKGKCGQ